LRERERETHRDKERERERVQEGTTFSCPRPKLKTEKKSDSALTLDSGVCIWETVPMSGFFFEGSFVGS